MLLLEFGLAVIVCAGLGSLLLTVGLSLGLLKPVDTPEPPMAYGTSPQQAPPPVTEQPEDDDVLRH